MEIEEYASKFKPLSNETIEVAILMDQKNTFVANHMARYLVKIGINVDKIEAITNLNQLSSKVTHLITFQDKLSGDLFTHLKKNRIRSLVVEENFLSLDKENLDGSMLISQYTYFGNDLYTFLNEHNIPKVLIVEDDHLSSILIKRILEDEYCEIDIANNGAEGLELLTFALNNNTPYTIVYSDQNMPILSGSDMLYKYKELEALKSPSKKIVTVSVSGDAKDTTKSNYIYDYYATKPFSRKEITALFRETTK
jgi:two-component system chemotaxis response regulator CheY